MTSRAADLERALKSGWIDFLRDIVNDTFLDPSKMDVFRRDLIMKNDLCSYKLLFEHTGEWHGTDMMVAVEYTGVNFVEYIYKTGCGKGGATCYHALTLDRWDVAGWMIRNGFPKGDPNICKSIVTRDMFDVMIDIFDECGCNLTQVEVMRCKCNEPCKFTVPNRLAAHFFVAKYLSQEHIGDNVIEWLARNFDTTCGSYIVNIREFDRCFAKFILGSIPRIPDRNQTFTTIEEEVIHLWESGYGYDESIKRWIEFKLDEWTSRLDKTHHKYNQPCVERDERRTVKRKLSFDSDEESDEGPTKKKIKN
jgi:hypothetical protein